MVGYILLLLGIGIVIYSFMNVYSAFTGQIQPYPLFTLEGIGLDFTNFIDGTPPPGTELRQELVKAELINQPLNYAAHLLFMGFVSSIGYKVARVGTFLVRSIKVKVKQEKEGINITAK